MSHKSIWMKINNPNDNPEQWIKQGYISISKYDRNNIETNLQRLESKNGTYNFFTKLKSGDYIYIYMICDEEPLLCYKFELNSKYEYDFHGYYLKKCFKCLDKIYQFKNWKKGKAVQQRWVAPKKLDNKGDILLRTIDPNIKWKALYGPNDNISTNTNDHIAREGEILKTVIKIGSRSVTIKKAYFEKYGFGCKLCGKTYLKANGRDMIIDVHHLHPIANGERETNINKDLKGLCPNCHRFVHSIEDFENKTWDKIKEKYKLIY